MGDNPGLLEEEAFRVPKNLFLSKSYSPTEDLTRDDYYFGDLKELCSRIGFGHFKELPSKKGVWNIYSRQNYNIPNFPEGETVLSSMLAIYECDKPPLHHLNEHAVLRVSPKQIDAEAFTKDLEFLTRQYLERPLLLGVPSRLTTSMTGLMVCITGGMAIGIAGGLLLGLYTGYSAENELIGATIGGFAGMAFYAIDDRISERRIKRNPALDEYIVGSAINNVFSAEQDHVSKVAVQRALYNTLRKKGLDISPEQFLDDVYEQMPERLIEERINFEHLKLEQEIEPPSEKERLESRAQEALSKMVSVALVLQGRYPQTA